MEFFECLDICMFFFLVFAHPAQQLAKHNSGLKRLGVLEGRLYTSLKEGTGSKVMSLVEADFFVEAWAPRR